MTRGTVSILKKEAQAGTIISSLSSITGKDKEQGLTQKQFLFVWVENTLHCARPDEGRFATDLEVSASEGDERGSDNQNVLMLKGRILLND